MSQTTSNSELARIHGPAFIWASDFKNRHVAEIVASLMLQPNRPVRTWSELAALPSSQVRNLFGESRDDQTDFDYLAKELEARGLRLANEEPSG